MHSALATELQRQLGLCSEYYSRNFYFSNGEGRLIPFKEDRTVLNYIQNNLGLQLTIVLTTGI